MISKILITLGVILACMWVLSTRASSKLRRIPNPEHERRNKNLRNLAIGFMALMAVAAGTIVYFDIHQAEAIVTVHVVNTQSGVRTSYRALKNQIRNDGFVTAEGLQVIVAGIERIEIETR